MAFALDQVFRDYYRFVYRTAYGVTRRPEDAEDVVRTLFLRLLRRGLPPDIHNNPKPYLYRATVNLSLDVGASGGAVAIRLFRARAKVRRLICAALQEK